jgi:flagellar protein FliS
MTPKPQPNKPAAQQYLRTRVLTATPEQLQMMLFDGVVKFGEQAKIALAAKNFEQVYLNTSRAQKIVSELMVTLKPELYPDLCGKLLPLYQYIYKRLTEAGVEHKTASLDEAIELLKFQRESWSLLLEQVGKTKAAAAAGRMQIPGPDPRMESSISMSA